MMYSAKKKEIASTCVEAPAVKGERERKERTVGCGWKEEISFLNFFENLV